jgi:hypothetical protein
MSTKVPTRSLRSTRVRQPSPRQPNTAAPTASFSSRWKCDRSRFGSARPPSAATPTAASPVARACGCDPATRSNSRQSPIWHRSLRVLPRVGEVDEPHLSRGRCATPRPNSWRERPHRGTDSERTVDSFGSTRAIDGPREQSVALALPRAATPRRRRVLTLPAISRPLRTTAVREATELNSAQHAAPACRENAPRTCR